MRVWCKRIIVFSGVLLVMATAGFFFGTLTFGAPAIPETKGADLVFSGGELASGAELKDVGIKAGSSGGTVMGLSAASENSSSAAPAAGSFTSQPFEADFAFNALGLHWQADTPGGSSVKAEVRFSSDGSSWSDWQPVTVAELEGPDSIGETASAGETIGELVFTDRARFFQYRMALNCGSGGQSPAIGKVTASYIDSKGYSQPLISPAAFIGRIGSLFSSDTAAAAPAIISRSQWGANPAYMNWDPEYVAPKKIIIHHTVTSNNDSDPAATIRSIYYYHAVQLGWGDIGYNYLIDQQGRIYEGRYGGNGVVAGHAYGWNNGTVGISVLGNYETAAVPAASYNALVDLTSWVSNTNHIDPWGWEPMNGTTLPNYLGHRDVGSTACPGANLYARLPQLRNDAHARYQSFPIIGGIRIKYDSLGAAPGSPLNAEYPVYNGAGEWVGQAQDFQQGRIYWNKDTGGTFWTRGGILAKYDSLGREGGSLGLPASDEYPAGAGQAGDFAGGKIYWGAATGAHAVYGEILARYLALGSAQALGLPTTDEYDAPGASGWRESDFQSGRIYWSAATGAITVHGAILDKYVQMGASATLGPPLNDEADIPGVPGGRKSSFSGGDILWSAQAGAHVVVPGYINDHYQAWGGPAGFLGLPLTDLMITAAGTAQAYQQGIITYYSPVGAHTVYGGICALYYYYLGPFGALGPAATDETDVAGVPGGRESDFTGGRIYWSAATGVHLVYGGILGDYLGVSGPALLGLPTGEEHDVAGVPGARVSDFERGSIYWSAATGAHEVHGGISGLWYYYGGPAGYLGLPLTDETDVAGGRGGVFQRGNIYWSAATGVHLVYGGILGDYLGVSGPALLGLPTGEEHDVAGVPGARVSDFERGSIYWSAATGAHEVHGGILDKWSQIGGPTGLGLPLSDEYDIPGAAGARESDFQYGRIYWSAATGAHEVHGGILDAYLSAGAAAGSLGLPSSDEYDYASGRRSDFQGGYITWSMAGGVQVTQYH